MILTIRLDDRIHIMVLRGEKRGERAVDNKKWSYLAVSKLDFLPQPLNHQVEVLEAILGFFRKCRAVKVVEAR